MNRTVGRLVGWFGIAVLCSGLCRLAQVLAFGAATMRNLEAIAIVIATATLPTLRRAIRRSQLESRQAEAVRAAVSRSLVCLDRETRSRVTESVIQEIERGN